MVKKRINVIKKGHKCGDLVIIEFCFVKKEKKKNC